MKTPRLLSRLLRAGVARHRDPAVGRRVHLTNAMALTLATLVLPYFPLLYRLGMKLLAWTIPLIAVAYLSVLPLNRGGHFSLARLALITFLNGAIFLYSGYLGSEAGGHLYFLATACLPIIIASVRERALIAYGVGVPMFFFEILTLCREAVFPPAIIGHVTQLWIYRAAVVPMTFTILLAELIYFSVSNERAEERIERNREFRLLLDNAGQGFLTADRRGRLGPEWSRIVETWLGALTADARVAEILRPIDAEVADLFDMGWNVLFADILPLELALDQLPKSLSFGGRHLGIEYRPFFTAESSTIPDKVLLVLSDITSEVERRSSEAAQHEFLRVVDQVLRDQVGFREFHQEASRLLLQLRGTVPLAEQLRVLHTLKGSCALCGVSSVAERCHALETRMAETGKPLSPEELRWVQAPWDELCERLRPIINETTDHIELLQEEYQDFAGALLRRVPHRDLLCRVETWRFEPAHRRFLRLGEQARALGRRLGKGEIDVITTGGGVRLDASRWAPFFSAFNHVIRNSIDHGLETPEEREAAGKARTGHLELRAQERVGEVVIAVADDGRGIQWERVAERARSLGLPTSSQADLEAALFAEGLSTRQEVSDISGRGVGLSAVQKACESMGGWIVIRSVPGQGTCFEFHVPLAPVATLGAASRPVGLPLQAD